MINTEIVTKTLKQLIDFFRSGELSSRQITDAFIEQIEAKNKDINAFVTTTFDLAREQADASDSRRDNDTLLGTLDGMPIALKDIVCTQGIRTTASSKMLENFVSPYDATVWKKIKDQGAVLLGKLNTDEFAMGASSENSAFGVTKNPYDYSRVAGGSSGGPAAAVRANMCAAAIGTDTGGSIRLPASFCGITGLKVSYGRVSRYGVMAMASSLDTIGPMTKTAEDAAIMLEAMAGKDPKDSTTVPDKNISYVDQLDQGISRYKIGLPRQYFSADLEPEVKNVIDSTQAILKSHGVEFVPVDMPHTKYAVPTYYIICPSEVSANMARFDGIRYGIETDGKNLEEIYCKARSAGLGEEVKRRIMLGTFALSAGYSDQFYSKAMKVRTLIKQDFDEAFKKVDALLTPVATSPAFHIGENTSDPLQMYMQDIFTAPASLAGVSALSVPVGKSREGLPIGAQLIGPMLGEGKLLQLAHWIEKSLGN
jgi:aspartyl-tRNA(Asn)/glutamyl-tRNA(Gln) amidotransferase subunit A